MLSALNMLSLVPSVHPSVIRVDQSK